MNTNDTADSDLTQNGTWNDIHDFMVDNGWSDSVSNDSDKSSCNSDDWNFYETELDDGNFENLFWFHVNDV